MLICQGPGRNVQQGVVSEIEVALTFDDGPCPETTPVLLDFLKEKGITATFFVIGEKAARYREIIQQIAASGHELGNHSYTHSEPRETGTKRFLDEIRKTRDLLEEITGRPCRWVRPPKGELSIGKQLGLWREGMTTVLWSVDPRDYLMSSAMQAKAWGSSYQPATGDILLLHDNHPWALDVVRAIAETGSSRGNIRFVRLARWV